MLGASIPNTPTPNHNKARTNQSSSLPPQYIHTPPHQRTTHTTHTPIIMPSSRAYSIIEPHPSAHPRSYIATGRGGAGNITKAPSNLTKGISAQGPPSRIHLSSVSSTSSSASTSSGRNPVFHTGRGGMGNVHPSSERAIFSFDEELERQLSQDRHAAPVYHVGRGGAGNVTSAYPRTAKVARKASDSSSEKSVGSVESGADAATRWVGGLFSKARGH